MLAILDPCEQLTRNISSATVTAADKIPSTEVLKRFLNKTGQGVKTSKEHCVVLYQAIEQQFGHIQVDHMYSLTTVLDPRYKDYYFDLRTKWQESAMQKRWTASGPVQRLPGQVDQYI